MTNHKKNLTVRTPGVLLALSLLASPGCFWVTTKAEGEKIRSNVSDLTERVQKKEETLESKLAKLEEVLEEATKVLRRNSADLGADFEELSKDVRTMQGLVTAAKRYTDDVRQEVAQLKKSTANDREVMAKRLASIEQRLDVLEKKAADPTPKTAKGLYEKGKAAFDAGDYVKARSLLKRLVVRFPGHDRADDGQYYRGEAYFREKDYDGAIREFQKVFDKYAKSPLADDALFRAAEAAQKLRRCSEARAYLGLLRQKYPKSSLVKKSKAMDKVLRRNAKKRKFCLS